MDGNTLRQLRETNGITQADLAARLLVTQQYVSKVEKAARVSELTERLFRRAILEIAFERMPAA